LDGGMIQVDIGGQFFDWLKIGSWNSEEAWTGKKVNYSFMKNFDYETFFHINKENRTKLEAKSNKCTFIGYGVNHFGYFLWYYENHKIIRSRDVVFNEKVMYKDQLQGKK
jgi:hypothetical protein